MFWVYVIRNDNDKIYIGQTDNLEKRLKRHNGKMSSKSRSFTKLNSGKWHVIYSENCNTRIEAIRREKELKSFRGREFIKIMIMAR